MYAQIVRPVNFRKLISYHEVKVRDSKAELIHSSGFLQDTHQLTRKHIIDHFERLHSLNMNCSVKNLHVILSFAQEDKLQTEQLIAIADEYMDGIAFGKQPYLVYRHRDTDILHVHIVSTHIRDDGRQINDHDIGKKRSSPMCRLLNQKYKLAARKHYKLADLLRDGTIQKLQYGKMETRITIEKIVANLLHSYAFATFDEFNTLLQTYNVRAIRGRPGSKMHERKGLCYQGLNEKGKVVGQWITASEMPFPAGQKALEQKYRQNLPQREESLMRIRNTIALAGPAATTEQLIADLRQEGIQTIRQDRDGYIFIDHHTRSVVTDTALGEKHRLPKVTMPETPARSHKHYKRRSR